MKKIIKDIQRRNKVLFWFGSLLLLIVVISFLGSIFSESVILGTNAYSKSFKYSFSSWITCWSLSWILYYLQSSKIKKSVSWILGFSLFFENLIILIQSFRGEPSHYNMTTPLNSLLSVLIIFLMLIFSLTLLRVCVLFFNQQKFPLSQHYTWGVRYGILIFITSSILIGGLMFGMMGHTIGGYDGDMGLPILNWSTKFGDLRVAHFLGVHALQIIPLLSYYVFKKKNSVIYFSILYIILIIVFLIMAFSELPLLSK